jgi:YD repeat-containing protein
MKTVFRCLLVVLAASIGYAQTQTVAISKSAPNLSVTTFTYYNAGANPQYICKANSNQPLYAWAVTPLPFQGTLTSIVVSSNVGTVTTSANHGLNTNNIVVVSGSSTAALNGTYVIQSGGALNGGSATTFTISTSGVSNGTYSSTNLTISTTAPRTTAPQWSIEQFTYNTAGNPIADQFANGNTAQTNICDNKSTIGFN